MKKFFSTGLLLTILCIGTVTVTVEAKSNQNIGLEVNKCNTYMQHQDYQAALNCYRPLAIKGESHAQFNIAMFYEKGLGVTKDLSKAFQWYEKSASQGFSFAQAKLGEMYAFGVGTSQNCKQALYWINKSAQQNNIWALEDLTNWYQYGRCVSKNKNKEVYWRKKWQSIRNTAQ